MKSSNAVLTERSPVVAFLGGNLADDSEVDFAGQLGAVVVENTPLRICVNGYKGRYVTNNPSSLQPSFGFAVASAAASVLSKPEQKIRLLTKVSAEQLSNASSTFEFGTIGEPHVGNEQSRRLSIISSADVICLAGGSTGTASYFNFGLALDKPTLPLPFFGGAARKLWSKNQAYLSDSFDFDSKMHGQWLNARLTQYDQQGLAGLAERIVTALSHGVRTRCLVCMPFREHFEWVYELVIQPAARAACVDLVRLDLEKWTGDISAKFSSEIAQADSVIAIVTGQRPNVLYEVGFAHGLGKKVLFLCQGDTQVQSENVPLYLRNHRTVWYPDRWDDKGIVNASEALMNTLRDLNDKI